VSRYRFVIVAAVLVVFVAVGAYLLFGNKSSGPQIVTINVTVTGGTSMKPPDLSPATLTVRCTSTVTT